MATWDRYTLPGRCRETPKLLIICNEWYGYGKYDWLKKDNHFINWLESNASNIEDAYILILEIRWL